MAKLFSFASWNVEHFSNDSSRVRDCTDFLNQFTPDVFGIFEVTGREVFSEFISRMPTHHFFITETTSAMNTLVGVRKEFTAFITQREELKSDIVSLRPGAMVTVEAHFHYYTLLFVHLKSFDLPLAFGLRDDMVGHILSLENALARTSFDGVSRLICLGDFNTMGLNMTYSNKDMSAGEELDRFERRFRRGGMRRPEKTHAVTWWGGSDSTPPSNLDHVFVSEAVNLIPRSDSADIAVHGWPELDSLTNQISWINRYSDHALLYGEVGE